MNSISQCILKAGFISIAFASVALAYDQPTHREIARHAADSSILSDRGTLRNLGLRYAYDDNVMQTFANAVDPDAGVDLLSGRKSIKELIADGAMQEDTNPRSLAHFYDPTTGLGLGTVGLPSACQDLFNAIPGLPWFAAGSSFLPSPDWSIEDAQDIQGQSFSYKDARRYFWEALTTTDRTTRDQYFGKTFQTLGQVIHHIEDMAQPQHVRNDPHLTLLKGEPCENPSFYEEYANDNRGALNYVPPYDMDLSLFPAPRSFWSNHGKGLAEFTNANFVSAGTNFDTNRYSLPVPTIETVTSMQQLCAQSSLPCQNLNLTGNITFFGSQVYDVYAGQTSINVETSTSSVFDPWLKKVGDQPVYSINRFNADAALSYLIPRAVAYSTGLLNYFFRGNLQISLPDEGVYAIADSALPEGADPQTSGFLVVKAKIRNLTGGTDANGNAKESIATGSSGSLIAVAKFHRNHCYAIDLSGEYGSLTDSAGQQDWLTSCRDSEEEIVVSDRADPPDGINGGPQEVTFYFTPEIPFSATDLYLQVVYRGPLGQEPDAVVVTTKDISEPTYLFNYDNKDIDQFCAVYPDLSGRNLGCPSTTLTFHQWCTGFDSNQPFPDDATCSKMESSTLRVQFSQTAAPIPGYDGSSLLPDKDYPINLLLPLHPLVELPALPVWPGPNGIAGTTPGNLSRVAVLTDADSSNTALLLSESDDTVNDINDFAWKNIVFTPTINQLGDDDVWLSTAPSYQRVRDQYIGPNSVIPMADPSMYIFGISPLQLQCSQISPSFGGSAACNWTPPFPETW